MAANRSNNTNSQGQDQASQGAANGKASRGNSQSGNSGNSGNSQGSGGIANRGFASMDPQRQRQIAAEGGRAAHASGNAHEFTPEEARRAGALSHKNDGNRQGASSGNSQSANRGNGQSGNRQADSKHDGAQHGKGVQGGTPEQHAAAGRQSHKNDR